MTKLLHAALATAAAVALQVLLPRIFSVVLWYHLGFFAVSLAMAGFAVGGLIVRRWVSNGRIASVDAGDLAAGAAGATCLAAAVVVRLPIDPLSLLESWVDGALLVVTGLVTALPFVLLGALVCLTLERGKDVIGRVYGATFFGGAAGAAIGLAAMATIGAPRAVGVAALLPMLAAPRSLVGGPGIAALVLVGATIAIPSAMLPLTNRKHFPKIAPEQVLHDEWNATSHVTFYDNPERHGLWEIRGVPVHQLPKSIGVAIDQWAITSILDVDRGGASMAFLDRYPPTLAWVGAEEGFDALVIGAGGGVDVLAALHASAGHVDAVEINPSIVGAVQGRFKEFAHDLYGDPRVDAHVAEGRHFVEQSERKYDRIVLSGVDTFAATEAGAFALSENYLYTVEAVRAYYDRLKPGGVLALTRWWYEPPRQTLRLTITATHALMADGITDIRPQVFLARIGLNSLFLLKKGDFSDEERRELSAASGLRGATVVFPDPAGEYPVYSDAMTVEGAARVVEESAYRVDATSDDRPFFFENSRLSGLFKSEGDWIHGRVGGQELLAVTLAVLMILALPMLLSIVRGPGSARERVLGVAPFLCLGCAYLFVEIPLMQRLALVLGHPVYAVAVVLVTMLVGSGVGSLLVGKISDEKLWAAPLVAAATILAIPIGAHPLLLEAVDGEGTVARVVAVVAFLSVPSLVMGMPFPAAIQKLRAKRPLLVPQAFAANGLASVLAGPIAVIVAMNAGFEGVLAAACAAYIVAALTLR